MNYKDLVADVAQRSGLRTDVVGKVLFHLPDALIQMEVGHAVRTPLGVFRTTYTPERPVTLPDQKSTAIVPARTLVRLRSGSRLQVKNEDDEKD